MRGNNKIARTLPRKVFPILAPCALSMLPRHQGRDDRRETNTLRRQTDKTKMNTYFIVVDSNPETGARMKYYSRAADVEYWSELWTKVAPHQPYHRELRGHLPHQLRATFSKWVKPGARILEAGCGLAHFTVAAHALGYRSEGLDWSEKTIRRLSELFPHIPWYVGDVRKLEFDDGVFDAVYSPGVCEHFEEGPARILAETRRVLRPRGIAVVSTPCFNRWLQDRATRFTVRDEPIGEFYQYAFTPNGMSRLLEHLGFELLHLGRTSSRLIGIIAVCRGSAVAPFVMSSVCDGGGLASASHKLRYRFAPRECADFPRSPQRRQRSRECSGPPS